MNYLHVSVYTNTEYGDCTLGGVTSDPTNKLVVPCESGNVTEEDVVEAGYVVLEPMAPAFKGCPVRFSVRGEKRWAMAGGNFVYTSDGRFKDVYGWNPVSVHDRVE